MDYRIPTLVIKEPFDDDSPLDPLVHRELIRDKAYFSQLAGIDERWLWQPLSSHAGYNEVQWVLAFKRLADRGVRGLLYVGQYPELGERLQAVTGALVRNFIDARIRPTGDINFRGDDAHCSALVIPDLCLGAEKVPDWMKREVRDLLVKRDMEGKQTIAVVREMDMLAGVYSDAVSELLSRKKRFPKVPA